MQKKTLLIASTSLVALIGIAYLLFAEGPLTSSRVNAFSNSNEIKGFAWSSNIGWISFNCADTLSCGVSNYKVSMDGAGNLSGFAWSSNIGWINANPAGGYPSAPAHGLLVDMNSGEISGWMRACGGSANMPASCDGGSVDGWDGWIKITDAKIGQGGAIGNNAGTGGGWAWGSDVVGWINFYSNASGVVAPHVECDFAANPSSIILPESSTLSWSCNAYATPNRCAIGSATNLPVSGNRTVSPSSDTTYTLTCQGLGGPAVRTALVRVGSEETSTSSSGVIRARIRETVPGQ